MNAQSSRHWQEDGFRYTYVIGHFGCGKTTILDYYLRCYCPAVNEEEFAKKLVLRIDCREVTTEVGFTQAAYEQIAQSVRRAFKERGISEEKVLRGATPASDKDRVELMFDYLAKVKSEYEYVVLWIDNLDQSTPAARKKSFSFVDRLINTYSDINFWRVYFALWPDSYMALRGHIEGCPGFRGGCPGPVDVCRSTASARGPWGHAQGPGG